MSALAGITVLVWGFGAMLLFWLVGAWNPDLPGLFSYRAATLGDGVLLPVGVALLVLGAGWLPNRAHRETLWTAVTAVLGLGVAAGIQAVWLADSHPARNWTLPRAHEFTSAGWWHAIFFIGLVGATAGLACLVLRRLRRADTERLRGLAASGWLAGLVFSGGGFLGLAALDNVVAVSTAAGKATAVGLAAAALLWVAGLIWALTKVRDAALRPAVTGVAAVAGLCALAAHGLPHLNGLLVVVAVLVCSALSLALAGPRLLPAGLFGLPLLAACLLLTLGAAGLGLHLVPTNGALAAGICMLAGVVAVGLTRRSGQVIGDTLLTVVVSAYAIGLIVLTGWLRLGRTSAEANLALGFASFFLDGLVIGLIRQRFQEVIQSDARQGAQFEGLRTHARDARPTEEVGREVLMQVLGFGVAALLALITLYVSAASFLGTNRGTGSPQISYAPLLAGLGAAGILGVAALVVARRHQRRRRGVPPWTPLDIDRRAGFLGGLGLVAAIVALLAQFHEPLHFAAPAAAAALLFAILVNEDVLRSGARLHLHSPGEGGRFLAALAGLTSGLAVFWLLTVGLWSGDQPASAGASAAATVGALALTAVIVILASAPVAYGLRTRRLTPQPPFWNFILVQAMYAALGLLGFVLPVFVVGRIDLFHPQNVGLVAVSSLAILPSLIGVVVWVLHNNQVHLAGQIETRPDGLDDFASDSRLVNPSPTPSPSAHSLSGSETPGAQDELDKARVRWLACHIAFQNRAALFLLGAGAVWMAAQLIR
jgi:hypothetical protein